MLEGGGESGGGKLRTPGKRGGQVGTKWLNGVLKWRTDFMEWNYSSYPRITGYVFPGRELHALTTRPRWGLKSFSGMLSRRQATLTNRANKRFSERETYSSENGMVTDRHFCLCGLSLAGLTACWLR